MAKYEVEIVCWIKRVVRIEVTADNPAAAREAAIEESPDHDWDDPTDQRYAAIVRRLRDAGHA